MKALNFYLLSFFVFGLCLNLDAQRDLYNWKISPQGGIVHYGSEFQLPENADLYGAGLSLDRRLGRAWTVGVNFLWMESEGGQVESSKYGGARLGFHWDNGFLLSERALISPFHKIGFGYGEETIMRNPNSSVMRTGYIFSFENGVKLRFGDRITVDLALELLAPEQIVLSGEVAERNRYHFYKLGLNYHFGRRESTFRGPVFRTAAQSDEAYRSEDYREPHKQDDKREMTLSYLKPLSMRDTLETIKLKAPEHDFELNADTLKYDNYDSDSTYIYKPLNAEDSLAIFMKLDSLYKSRNTSENGLVSKWREITVHPSTGDTTSLLYSDTTKFVQIDTTSTWQKDTTATDQEANPASRQVDTIASWQRDTTAYWQNDTTTSWRTDTVFIKEMWEPTEKIYREEIRYKDYPKSSEDRRTVNDKNQEKDQSSNQEMRQIDDRDPRNVDSSQKSTAQTGSDRRYEDDRRGNSGNTVVMSGTGGSGSSSDLEEQNRLLREQNDLLRSLVSPTAAPPETNTTAQPKVQRDLFVASVPSAPRRERTSADSTEAEKRLAFQLDSLKREKEQLDNRYQALITSQAYTRLDSLESDSLTFDPDSIPKETIDNVQVPVTKDPIVPPPPPLEPQPVPVPSVAPGTSDVNYPVVCTFGLDKEMPSQGERDKLDQVAADLTKFPERKVSLTGHTDASGSDAYNLTLSKNRAQWVADYLTERGVKASQLDVRGKGSQESTQKYDPQERRVVIATTP